MAEVAEIDINAFTVIDVASKFTTFDELEARDPAELTASDRLRMIEHHRSERAAWKAKEKKE